MKRLLLPIIIFALLLSGGCVKSAHEASSIEESAAETAATSAENSPKESSTVNKSASDAVKILTARQALDLVKEKYGGMDFELVNDTDHPVYRDKNNGFYLGFDNYNSENNSYVIHEYESVIDDPDTGRGHIVTYNWFDVNAETGEITTFLNAEVLGTIIFE